MGFNDLLETASETTLTLLGQVVTYTPSVGAAVEVTGIYDEAYSFVDVGEPGVSSSGPAVFLNLEDLPADALTDTEATITVESVSFTIFECKPDGKGFVVYRLHKA
jgi:hypothetical protein